MAKIEGTSQTFGQLIISNQNYASPTAAQTTQAIEGSIKSNTASTAESIDSTIGGSVASNRLAESSSVVPVDVLVEVVQNTASNSTAISSDKKTSIAMAAASGQSRPTAVVDADNVVDRALTTNSLLGGVATVVPNVVEYVTVLGSSVKTQDEIREALTEAQKIDLSITLRSQKSEAIEFNTLKKPGMSTKFLYNFFSGSETNIQEQEDQSKDPLLTKRPVDTPRYVDLRWAVTEVTEPLAGTEGVVRQNAALRRQVFSQPRGQMSLSTNLMPFSVEKKKKILEPYKRDGLSKKVVDMHEPEKIFSALANDGMFSNKVSMKIETSTQDSVIDEVPYKQVK